MNEDVSVSLLFKNGWVVHCYVSVYQEGIFLLHPHKKLERHMYYAINWNDSIPNFDLSFLFVRVGGSGSKKNKHELYWGTEKKTHGIYKYYRFAGYYGWAPFHGRKLKATNLLMQIPSIGTNIYIISHLRKRNIIIFKNCFFRFSWEGGYVYTSWKTVITTVDSSMIPANHLGCIKAWK